MANVSLRVAPQGMWHDGTDIAFWHSSRPGRDPEFRGVLARGEPHVDEHQKRCEVEVRPGYCVAWTAREGHCTEPAEGLTCVKHAADFEGGGYQRNNRLTDEDMAILDAMPPGRERDLKRKSLQAKRARQDPAYYTKHLERRRAMRAAGVWKS